MKPRIAFGNGRAPMHISAINGPAFGPYQIHISEQDGFWGWLGFSKIVACRDDATLAVKLDEFAMQSLPFSKGGMCLGPSDEMFFRREEQGWPTGYLEIAWRSNGKWFVREITQESSQWEKLNCWEKVDIVQLLVKR